MDDEWGRVMAEFSNAYARLFGVLWFWDESLVGQDWLEGFSE